jgi:Na+/citrate or Na+/malate symporter
MSSKFGQNIAAALLGVVLIIIVAGAILLELNDKFTPDMLKIIGGSAVGALATLATGSNPSASK